MGGFTGTSYPPQPLVAPNGRFFGAFGTWALR